jgi:ribulose-5-phosphate 4-epimerase/fuculose-1-phosphate aldolase
MKGENWMTYADNAMPSRPSGVTVEEWKARLELCACYRLFDHLGWAEMIFNHITVRVGAEGGGRAQYLINPYGLH